MLHTRRTLTSLALLLAIAVPACGSSTSSDTAPPVTPPTDVPDGGASEDAGPKAGPVTGTPDADKITEDYGFFVAPSGNDAYEGSRARPFATLAAGIAHAAKVGKIVFVCTGTYAEALVVADSISVIGGLDCIDPLRWKTGAPASRINAPTSPAATAKTVHSPTRLESLDIVAPAATDPGASSIGLFANDAPGLTIVGSKITAGNGANGTNGAEGVQLVQAGNIAGADSPTAVACHGPSGGPLGTVGNCGYNALTGFHPFPNSAPGVSQCTGAAGKNGTNGLAGGTGGLYQVKNNAWVIYNGFAGNGSGGTASGAPGPAGKDGDAAAALGSLTADGYVPANGSAGGDGTPGQGGNGGTGGNQAALFVATPADAVGAPPSGPGGGAGGCPGLAGGPGTGGGASIGVALIASPIVLDSTSVASATGGAGGLGTLGSDPTPGGAAGKPAYNTGTALPGGNGGTPGVSTNGSNGPSIGILHSGAAPTLTNNAKATPGTGAPAIAAVPHTDPTTGATRTIPATPAGVTADVKQLGN